MKKKSLNILKSGLCKLFWFLFILESLYIIYTLAPKECEPIITLNQDFVQLSGPNLIREGQESAFYKVSVNQDLKQDLNITLAYSGTAESGVDFVATKKVTIKKGELSTSFRIKTIDDPLAEFNEEFAVKIATVNGKSFLNEFKISNPNNIIYTKILDEKKPKNSDKDSVHVSINGAKSVYENSKRSDYRVELSHAAADDIDLNISYSGEAEFGVDYIAPKNITIKKGEKSATFTLKILNDNYKEKKESVEIFISDFDDIGFEDIRYKTSRLTIDIIDEKKPKDAVILKLKADKKVLENKKITYTLSTKKTLESDITLKFKVISKDANRYPDSLKAILLKGTNKVSFELLVKDDNLLEKRQRIELKLLSIESEGYELVKLKVLNKRTKVYDNMKDSSTPAEIKFLLESDKKIYEDSKELKLSLKSSQTLLRNMIFYVKYTGTAKRHTDFNAPSKIFMKKGQNESTLIIKLIDDNILRSKNLNITLSTKNSGGFEKIDLQKMVSFTILDEENKHPDQAAYISLSGPKTISEGKSALYKLSLTQKLEADLTVNFTYSPNAEQDMNISNSFVIEKGLKNKIFSIPTLDDEEAENVKSFTIELDSVKGGGLETILIDEKSKIETSITDEVDIKKLFQKVVASQKIVFEYAKDSIDEKSFSTLDEIVQLLNRFPRANLIVEGHTNSAGNRHRNLKLSKRRARSVKQYLLDKGVDKKRLASVGYGQYRPMVPDSNPKAQELNKRVEFKVNY